MKRISLLFALVTVSSLAFAQITSSFDTDADGWTFFKATALTPTHSVSGGNPGGSVSITYTSFVYNYFTAGTEVWKAPAKFLGNQVARSMDMNLRFDLQSSHTGVPSDANGDVIIRSSISNAIVFTLPTKPAIAPAWSSYSLKLDETQGWRMNNTSGALATRNQIIAVLTNIASIEIRGTYATNATYTSGLDNVTLEQKTLGIAPAATSLSVTTGKPGDVITITGSGFNTTAANNVVSFGIGGVKGVVQSATATQLSVAVPPNAPFGPIVITNTVTGLTTHTAPFNPVFSGGGRIIPSSFKPRLDIATIQIESIAASDIDGDGWIDLALTNDFTDRVIDIHRNLGTSGTLSTASFDTKVSLAYTGVSVNGTGLWFIDLDGDGKPDAITSSSAGGIGQFITFRNTSTPGSISFEAPEYWQGASDESPTSFVGDLDGDGRPELVSGEGSIPGGFWFNQNLSRPGNIEFGSWVAPVGLAVVNGFTQATAADLNGDGKPELIVTNGQGQAIDILENVSTPGAPAFNAALQFGTNQYTTSPLVIADMNLDGKNDILYKTSGEVGFHIRINADTDGILTTADFASDLIITGDLSSTGGIAIADINGDGKPDIVACDNTDVGVYENRYSGGVFDATALIPSYQSAGINTGATAPIAADLNGDGRPEIIVGVTNGTPSDKFSIYENKNVHAPVIAVNTVSPLAAPVGATVTITGDFFSTTPTDNRVRFGTVEATVLTATKTQLTVEVPAGADYAPVSVTKDGLQSTYRLPFQTKFSSGVTFDNTHFAAPVTYTLTTADYNLATGDLNRDGKPDVVAAAGNPLAFASFTYAFRNAHSSGAINATTLVPNDTIGPANFNNPKLQDFDGDGYVDIIDGDGTLKRNVSTLSDINFSANINYSVSEGIMTFGDFNSDGKADIALTNATISLLLLENRVDDYGFVTTPISSFGTVVTFARPSGNGGSGIGGDFDGDGYDDVITANANVDNISIFRNTGLGRINASILSARVDFAVSDVPNLLYSGDFDSDGKLDLLLTYGAGTNPTRLTVLRNTSTSGTISFASVDLTNPSTVTRATIADLDGDGKPEIITTSESGNRFSVFKNLHTSGALTAASFAAPFNTTVTAPRGITTADLNLDGKPDIILTRAAGLLVVYENLVPSIGPPTITSFTPALGAVGATVTIAGTNFDATPANNIVYFGATRAVVTTATATGLTVTVPSGATYAPITVLNASTGLQTYSMSNFTPTFSPNKGSITACDLEPKLDFTSGSNPLSVAIADLNGDGKPDLAVTNTASNTISILRNTNTAAGSVSYAAKVDYPTGGDPQVVATGDLDGDGKPDLAVANYIGFSVSVFRNTSTGPGAITYDTKIDLPAGTATRSVSIGDLDGDGKADLAVANDGGSSVSIFRNNGTGIGTISYAPRVDFATGGTSSSPQSVCIADFDGDGKADLAVANFVSSTISVFRNNSSGPGNISFAAKVDFATGSNPNSVAAGDLDGDSKTDLAVVNKNSNSVSVFRNSSTGTGNIGFAAKTDFVTGLDPRSVSIADLDGDGKADLAVANANANTVSVLRNISSGAGNIGYATAIDFVSGTRPVYVSIGDLDGDGKADVAVANASSNSVSIIRNNPILTTPTISSFTPASGQVGTSITVTGTNFSAIAANNVVSLNAIPAVVTASTPTSITFAVPAGATTGKIAITAACGTVTSTNDFTVTSPAGTVTITTEPLAAVIGGVVTKNLVSLISTSNNNLDISSITITVQPPSGAVATISNGVLTVDYTGIGFTGKEVITIRACDANGNCTTQQFEIEVTGGLVIYNGISPDGDDKNAVFFLANINLLPETAANKVTIYNRWGDQVFEVENYDNVNRVFRGFNKNGDPLPSGTYYYRIKFASGIEERTGFIALRR